MNHLCKITPAGSDVTYYLLANVRDDPQEVGIALTDGEAAWNGMVTQRDFEKQSAQSGISTEDVRDQSIKALTGKDVGSLVFEYQIEISGPKMTLVWKKVEAEEYIKFQLGNTTLKKSSDPTSTISKIIEFSLKSVNELSTKIASLKTENERLTNERASALKRLEKCVSAKETVEFDLYSKFVVVINDKKAKIRKLQEKIKDLQDGVNDSTIYKASDEKPKRRRLSSSGASDSPAQQSDYETDEEKPSSSSTQTQRTQKRGKSDAKNSDQEDESLMLDDGEEKGSSVVSRRKRRQSSMKKGAASKPVIPKVSSATPDNRSSNRKPSLRKRGSNTPSNKSSDIEADDLIDELA